MKRPVFEAGLDPAHLNGPHGFTLTHARQKRPELQNEAANGGENQHKTAGHGRTLRKLLFITKAEFFLFSSGFRRDPLAKGGYFTQFCPLS